MRKSYMVLMLAVMVISMLGCASKPIKMNLPQIQEISPTASTVIPSKVIVNKHPLLSAEQIEERSDILSQARTPHGRELVRFDFDSTIISEEAQEKLTDIAVLLQNCEDPLTVAGYCDERGTEAYNLALGQKRADEVARYLSFLGVYGVNTISYGKSNPIGKDHDEANWAMNRCVRLTILMKPQEELNIR
jgi:peptidoglycan-associated lipoprotein